ncbi:hypothetical protein [Helicobacter mesocricetorum]|uniref:hypothetical protein n=1 Tax=Helicobacter mesocricetorum TaxID=87012 RepID=UPI000CF03387|nr:hypothetical protein [Helicobacter mesocricetorum]
MVLGGCATISNQPKQKISITTSNGESVVADINGNKVDLPVYDMKISRSTGATIRILKADNPCYEDTQLRIEGKDSLSGWFWGNILTGGTTGSVTDAVTGSMWTYTNPNFVVPVKKTYCN